MSPGETPPTTNGGINGLWKYLALAALGIGVGQFLPQVTTLAVSTEQIEQIEKKVDENTSRILDLRKEIRLEAERTRTFISSEIDRHALLDAHAGAARLLLQHSTQLADQAARILAIERGHEPPPRR